jgi:crotonobetainyl-CoA:carnitine CoA-transferase CaiB-like acyl-CoA transferase
MVFQLARDQWKEAMTALGFYEEVVSAGFSHLGVAMESAEKRTELLALLDRLFATDTRDHWVAKLREADIVSAPINTMLEAARDPDVLANGYITEVDYPKQGKRLSVHGTPWQFSETPASIGIAPELGEHNDEVLASLGYGEPDIRGLRERKII